MAVINFHSHGVEITPALREFITDKFERLTHRGDVITRIDVALKIEKTDQIAEATIHVKGKDLHAQATDSDLYNAVDSLIDKLNKQIVKHRETTTEHR